MGPHQTGFKSFDLPKSKSNVTIFYPCEKTEKKEE